MKSLKIVLSLSMLQDEYQAEQVKAGKEAAQRLGVDLEILDTAGDSIRQCEQLIKVVQATAMTQLDALIVDPIGHAGMPQVARATAQAGIGWVVLNRDVEYLADLRSQFQAPAFTVTSDDVELGRIQGRQSAALVPEGSSVLYLQGPMNSFVAQLRTVGMRETTPSGIDVRIIRADWTRDGAARAVNFWLRLPSLPSRNLALVAAQNDAMAQGAKDAFKGAYDSKRWSHLIFTGCDATPQRGERLVRGRGLTATVLRPPTAGIAVKLLAEALREGTNPALRTVVAPTSYPSIEGLASQRKQAVPHAQISYQFARSVW